MRSIASPSDHPGGVGSNRLPKSPDGGRAVVDLVAFVGRWEVGERTFRPPPMHRNAATEINCVVSDPSPRSGYLPGHLPHAAADGPRHRDRGLRGDPRPARPRRRCAPRIPDASLRIMFESALPFRTTARARQNLVDPSFLALFGGMKSQFSP